MSHTWGLLCPRSTASRLVHGESHHPVRELFSVSHHGRRCKDPLGTSGYSSHSQGSAFSTYSFPRYPFLTLSDMWSALWQKMRGRHDCSTTTVRNSGFFSRRVENRSKLEQGEGGGISSQPYEIHTFIHCSHTCLQ